MAYYLYAYDADGDKYGNHTIRRFAITSEGAITSSGTQTIALPTALLGDVSGYYKYTGPVIRQVTLADGNDFIIFPGQATPDVVKAPYGYINPTYRATIELDGSITHITNIPQLQTGFSTAGGAAALERRNTLIDLFQGSGAIYTSSGWATDTLGNIQVQSVTLNSSTWAAIGRSSAGYVSYVTGPSMLWAYGNTLYAHSSKDLRSVYHTNSIDTYKYLLSYSGTTGVTSISTSSKVSSYPQHISNGVGDRMWVTSDGSYVYTLSGDETSSAVGMYYTIHRYSTTDSTVKQYDSGLYVNTGESGDTVYEIVFTFLISTVLTAIVRIGEHSYRIYQGTFNTIDPTLVTLTPTNLTFSGESQTSFNGYTTSRLYSYCTNIPRPIVAVPPDPPIVTITQYDATPDGGVLHITGTATHALGVDALKFSMAVSGNSTVFTDLPMTDSRITFSATPALNTRPTSTTFSLVFDGTSDLGTIHNGVGYYTIKAEHHTNYGGTDPKPISGVVTKFFRYDRKAPSVTVDILGGGGSTSARLPGTHTQAQIVVDKGDSANLVKVEYADVAHNASPSVYTSLWVTSTSYGLPSTSYSPGLTQYSHVLTTPDQTPGGTADRDLYIRATDGSGNVTTSGPHPYYLDTTQSNTATITNLTDEFAFCGTPGAGSLSLQTTGFRRTMTMYYTYGGLYGGTLGTYYVGEILPSPSTSVITEAELATLPGMNIDPALTNRLAEGTYRYYVEVTDVTSGGAVRYPALPTAYATFYVDHSGPTLLSYPGYTTSNIAKQLTFSSQNPTFTIVAQDTLAKLAISSASIQAYWWNGATWVDRTSSWVTGVTSNPNAAVSTKAYYAITITDALNSYPNVSYGNESNRLKFVISDRGGNSTTLILSAYVVDPEAPVVQDIELNQSFGVGNI